MLNDLSFDQSFKTLKQAPRRFKHPRSYFPEATPMVRFKNSIPLPENKQIPTLSPSYSQRPNPQF
jgi:hypothetical protein